MTATNGVPCVSFRFLPLLSILIFLCGSPVFAEEKPSPEKVAKIRASASGGDAQAQHYLGKCLTYEMGVKKDLAEAFKWFQKAADQGNVSAQYRVGICYYDGVGVPKDDEQAILWLELAAHGGDAEAKERLGYLYHVLSLKQLEEFKTNFDGDDSYMWRQKQAYMWSQKQAYMWYNLAAAEGSTKAKKNLGKLTPLMSARDIDFAQGWSSSWKADPAALLEERTKQKNDQELRKARVAEK